MMNKSKCYICPSGYEVASMIIVKTIYAECVLVLISQDHVLPFSDVLDWDAFSVQVFEKMCTPWAFKRLMRWRVREWTSNAFDPSDFCEVTCRRFKENHCNRGGYCNFMHVKQIGRVLKKKLFGRYRRSSRVSRSRSRSVSPQRRKKGEERKRGDYQDHRDRRDYHGSRHINTDRSTDWYDRHDSNCDRQRRTSSPIRERSKERTARIEQWNRGKEENP
ncbi:hypothetical protein GIB67_028089 [Kingdonia uniflora]|uniref:C3H1-type domain-containing protein n=1 Tax=Kingdonia uniflora TaxID=39325 RepID=A0A7J7NWE6_9MAGN|nr:hypothetical protein GIB67_028089 [Kingdonia uniflora]